MTAHADPNPAFADLMIQGPDPNKPAGWTVSGLGSSANPLVVTVQYHAYSGTFNSNTSNVVWVGIDCGNNPTPTITSVPVTAPSQEVDGSTTCAYTAVGSYTIHMYVKDDQAGAVQAEARETAKVKVVGQPTMTVSTSATSGTAPYTVNVTGELMLPGNCSVCRRCWNQMIP